MKAGLSKFGLRKKYTKYQQSLKKMEQLKSTTE